jgi:heme A synthase
VSTKYLLPCRCGRQITVELREAGETAVCPCGQSLPIPTMLEMTALEPVLAEASPPSEHVWEWQHRMLLLGGTLLLLGISFGTYFHWTRPVAPSDTIDPEAIRQSASNLTPLQTWHYWRLMKQGLDRRTDQRYADAMTIHRWEQGFAGMAALIGIALIGVGVAMGKRQGEGETGRPGDKETGRQEKR